MQNDVQVPRILLYVEDNSANVLLVEQVIARRKDLKLLTTKTGRAGVQIARDYFPDVIVMDINLPDISGIEALKILRADSTTSHIPVMALSSNAYPRQIERGLQEGFFRYLTKPFLINDFSQALDAILLQAAKLHQMRQNANDVIENRHPA